MGEIMSWNNRIVKRKDGWYAVHEVYYNKDGEAHAMTVEPAFRLMVNPDEPTCGCGPEEIRDALKLMLRDVEKDLGERGIFEEPDKWANDGHDDAEEDELISLEEGMVMIGGACGEVAESTKELAQQVADMESEGGPVQEWAKKLADDVGNATD